MLATDQLELLSAGLRHMTDAERLLNDSPDQSWHLAGFATECIRKAGLTNEAFRKALGHEQSQHFDRLFEIVSALDPGARRHDLTGWAPVGSRLSEWKEIHRYDRRNAHAVRAPELVREVRAHHDRTLTSLWLAEPFDPESL